MSNLSKDNAKIAKNTAFLYLRMLISMAISLYTSRAVLATLGVKDFGIYNVVGGVVAMFSFLNNAMLTTTQRYLNFNMGQKRPLSIINEVFCTSVNIHILISFIILILAETIGYWFVLAKLVIPIDRIHAACWVYQTSILSTILLVVTSPYNALVIAREKMDVFAKISILDVFLRLIAVIILPYVTFDYLIVYGIMLLIVQLIISTSYKVYTKINFPESHFHICWNRQLFSSMSSFVGWSFIGSAAYISFTQGVNIVLNLFFGPAINAARGISVQVQSAILGFVANFQVALNPQITKNYSSGNIQRMHQLVYASCRYSFFLLYCLALPLIVECKEILSLWLVSVPEHTVNFVRLILITMLVETSANPMSVSAQATGKIKKYQLVLGTIQLAILPLSYFALLNFKMPEIVYLIHLCIMSVAQFIRLVFMKNLIQMNIMEFVKNVYFAILRMLPVSLIVPLLILWYGNNSSLIFLAANVLLIIISSFGVVYFLGLSSVEKLQVKKILINGYKKINNIIS